jgi:hypothetical protein
MDEFVLFESGGRYTIDIHACELHRTYETYEAHESFEFRNYHRSSLTPYSQRTVLYNPVERSRGS